MTGARNSRSLLDLDPAMRPRAERLLAAARGAAIPLTVTCTLRSMATQAALFAQGRTAPGKVVTNARPGYSFHNFGLAIDVVPTELVALPDWGETPECRAHAGDLWRRLGAIGTAAGLGWDGTFVHLPDRPHFEWSGGLTLAQLRAGKRPQ